MRFKCLLLSHYVVGWVEARGLAAGLDPVSGGCPRIQGLKEYVRTMVPCRYSVRTIQFMYPSGSIMVNATAVV